MLLQLLMLNIITMHANSVLLRKIFSNSQVVSFLAEISNFFGWGDHVYDKKLLFCAFDRTADYSYTMFFACAGIATPVVSIMICYILIYVHVRRSRRKVTFIHKLYYFYYKYPMLAFYTYLFQEAYH